MQMLRKRQVLAKVGFSQTTLYEAIKHRGFPPPARLGALSMWAEVEVDEWLRERLAERAAKAAA
ncbi:helix-turn-helix transcriptional regulator [Rhodanobacter denitrificans]|uniref:helix-turn-helix transcriptional regulator n=1 Tax=Rhodanobacter denitrificans TaxID=666685 RepID=UPI000260FEDE|nr:phage transcriptional regulator AlpA [Rhodanobacter denitrificans]